MSGLSLHIIKKYNIRFYNLQLSIKGTLNIFIKIKYSTSNIFFNNQKLEL